MISSQARASLVEATGMMSGQQVQRSLSGVSSANSVLVFMAASPRLNLPQSPAFLKARPPSRFFDENPPDIC
jgi:hypothetical protein